MIVPRDGWDKDGSVKYIVDILDLVDFSPRYYHTPGV